MDKKGVNESYVYDENGNISAIISVEKVITEYGDAIEVTVLHSCTDNDEPEMKCKEYVIKPSTTYGKVAGVPADTLANGLLEVSKVMASNALDYDKLIADINKVKNDE